jgi:hypothetical protein
MPKDHEFRRRTSRARSVEKRKGRRGSSGETTWLFGWEPTGKKPEYSPPMRGHIAINAWFSGVSSGFWYYPASTVPPLDPRSRACPTSSAGERAPLDLSEAAGP